MDKGRKMGRIKAGRNKGSEIGREREREGGTDKGRKVVGIKGGRNKGREIGREKEGGK